MAKKIIKLIMIILSLVVVLSLGYLIYKYKTLNNDFNKMSLELKNKDLYYEKYLKEYEEELNSKTLEIEDLKEKNKNFLEEINSLKESNKTLQNEYEVLKDFAISEVLLEDVPIEEAINNEEIEKGYVAELKLDNILSSFDDKNIYFIKNEENILSFTYDENSIFRIINLDNENIYTESSIEEISNLITKSFENKENKASIWIRYNDKNYIYSLTYKN